MLNSLLLLFIATSEKDESEERYDILRIYYAWTFLEVALFASYIWSIVIYVTAHVISPFTVYQYYILKAFSNPLLDFHTLWNDQKPTSPLNENDRLKEFINDSSNADFIRANVPVINVYMPLTAPAFMYIAF